MEWVNPRFESVIDEYRTLQQPADQDSSVARRGFIFERLDRPESPESTESR